MTADGEKEEPSVALVTGASRGIGAAVLANLAATGMQVVGIARTEADLEEVISGIRSSGGEAEMVVGDVTDETVVESLFDDIAARYGRLDVLVNNAGIARFGKVEDLAVGEVEAVINLDVIAAYRCTQLAVRLMKRTTGTGKIISIGSVRSHWTEWGDAGAYNGAKVGLHAMMESIARQLHDERVPIAVGMVCPGAVEMHGGPPTLEKLPMDEVAKAVVHTATAPSSMNIFDTVLIPIGHSPW